MDSKAIIGNAMEEVLAEEFAEYINDLPLYTEHQFSERHNRKMNKLIKRQRKPYFSMISTAGRRAACVIVAFVVLSASALSVRAIREAFFDFITSIFSDHSVVTVESGTDSGYPETIEEEYYISALPEGFEKAGDERTGNSIDISYFRENDYILFTQYTKSCYEQNYDNEYTEYKEHIDGDEKYLVIENEYDTTYIWDTGKYIFTIQSNLNKDSILKLCKSTKIK
ncbi:MAG: DUF4367 domain-containing protein [Ruminococcus sp.]|nr:DUF4367 domain-containing protein [Ruminococcus sp.]